MLPGILPAFWPKRRPPNAWASNARSAKPRRGAPKSFDANRCVAKTLRREHAAQPRGEILLVIAAHRLVGDGRGDLAGARLERGAALRRIERPGFAFTRP